MMRAASGGAFATLLLLVLGGSPAYADSPCVTDGPVRALTAANGDLYAGGVFGAVAQRSGPGVPLAQAGVSGPGNGLCSTARTPEAAGNDGSGTPVRPFPEVAGGKVLAAIPDEQGGWYIGGSFTTVDGRPRDRLAHIASDGSVAPGVGDPAAGRGVECKGDNGNAATGAGCAVNALALQPATATDPDAAGASYADDGTLYVGGDFDAVGTRNDANLAAVDATTGTLNTGWKPVPSGGGVKALALLPVTVDVSVDGGATVTPSAMSVVFAGGDFTTLGSVPTNGLGAVWGVGATQSCVPQTTAPPTCTAASPGAAVPMGGGVPVRMVANAWNPNGSVVDVNAVALGQPVQKDSSGAACAPQAAPYPTANTAAHECYEYVPVYEGCAASAPCVVDSKDPTNDRHLKAYPFKLRTRIPQSSYSSNDLPGMVADTGTLPYGWAPPTLTPDANGAEVRALALSPAPQFIGAALQPAAAATSPVLYFGGEFPGLRAGAPYGIANVAAVKGVSDPASTSGSGGTVQSCGSAVNCAGLITSWNPQPDGVVRALAVAPGSPDAVYIGGDFANVAGESRGHAAEVAGAQGAEATLGSWDPELSGGEIDALALGTFESIPSVYAGGGFSGTGAAPRADLAAFDPAGNLLAWNPGATIVRTAACNASATVTCTADGSITCSTYTQPDPNDSNKTLTWALCTRALDAPPTWGGYTTSCNVLDPSSATSPPPCIPPPPAVAAVNSLVAIGNTIYIGGIFSHVLPPGAGADAANAAYDLAAVDASSGAPVPGFAPDPDDAVLALASDGASLFAGGSFSHVAGTGAGIAALDPATGSLRWGAPIDDSSPGAAVRALAASCSTLYVGGGFFDHGDDGAPTIGGQHRNFIAAIDPASGQVTPWDPEASSTVYAIQSVDGRVYAGGRFTLIGGAPRSGLAALDPATGQAIDGFSPAALSPTIVKALALAPDATTLYVGGGFTELGGVERAHLGSVDTTTGAVRDWHLATDDEVYTLLASDGALAAGGAFRQLGDLPQQGLATFAEPTTASAPACPSPPPQTAVESSPAPLPEVHEPAPAPDLTAPRITRFTRAPASFRVPPARDARRTHRHRHAQRAAAKTLPRSTTFRWVVSEAGSAAILIERALPGRRVGTSCLAPKRALRRAARCTRYVADGTLRTHARDGTNSLSFDGRVGRRMLPPGTYRATLRVTDAAGNVSPPRRLTFRTVA